MSLVWMDLETTGLDPVDCAILEVAVVITGDNLEVVAAHESLVIPRRTAHMDDIALEMHMDSGLWLEVADHGRPGYVVQAEATDFICRNGAEGSPLAGSSVHFDRSFLYHQWRNVYNVLGYRNLDVSTINEAAERWAPDVWEARPPTPDPKPHRAMADILASIDVARYWRGRFVRMYP